MRGIIQKLSGISIIVIFLVTAGRAAAVEECIKTDMDSIMFYDIWGTSRTNLFAVGDNGTFAYSTDNGSNWTVRSRKASVTQN